MTDTSMMPGIAKMKNMFLRGMSAVYLFAFASIYTQIPGLYGDDGILPVKGMIDMEKRGINAFVTAFYQKPSAVWLSPVLGLDIPLMLDFMAIVGILISFCGLISHRYRNMFGYAILWALYFSFYQVGQTFLWFQWDIQLLEAGFLTILLAPFTSRKAIHSEPSDLPIFWLVRWLEFRLVFSSGIVKLTSGCPTWWGLSALYVHFESQCLPNQLSWFAHHLPKSLLRLMVVGTYVILIAVPFLFFIPIASLRLFAFYCQLLFEVSIIATGNYNFFNLLNIVCCLAILHDEHWYPRPRALQPKKSRLRNSFEKLVTLFSFFTLAYWTMRLFSIEITTSGINSSVAFTPDDLDTFLKYAVPLSIYVGLISLLANIYLAFRRSSSQKMGGMFTRVFHSTKAIFYGCISLWIFSISLVPHTAQLDQDTYRSIWPVVRKWHAATDELQLVNSYGLFRRMTGVGGRPELIIEGSNSESGPWKEYHFLYKPGNITAAPRFIVPHQPRLDWQMWFAALGTYQQNPWLINFLYRLTEGSKDVLDLIDVQHNPFPKPPKFVRVQLYTYHYTTLTDLRSNPNQWWKRTLVKTWLPVMNKVSLEQYVKKTGIDTSKKIRYRLQNWLLETALTQIRRIASKLSPVNFVWSMFTSALTIRLLSI